MGVTVLGPTGLKANNYQNADFTNFQSSFVSPKNEKTKQQKKKKAFSSAKSPQANSFVYVNYQHNGN